MIPVEIVNVALLNKRFVLFLKGASDERALPIFIDDQQAQSIVIQINKVEIPRPLTHDLFKTVLDSLGCELIRIEVSDLIDDTFYAKIFINNQGQTIEFDARPSDAICLALRFGAPMFVSDAVMEKAGVLVAEETEQNNSESLVEESDDAQVQKSPLEELSNKLAAAIKEERYEDAARLRDEIKKLTGTN